jgi:ribosomal protein S18 acetylase RimI-like enzyme
VRPLTVHELDAHALGTVNFEAAGLIVAETDGRLVGFVHAGFGPDLPVESTRPFQVSHELGTVAMLVVEPDLADPGLASGLIAVAERYLQSRGAKVIYAGALFPLNPFYWGIYGGSEGSAVLASHTAFHRVVIERGYEPAGKTILLEADLTVAEPRDARAALIRRKTHVEFLDDAQPIHWWQNVALGEFQIMEARLLLKGDQVPIARAQIWDMGWFGRADLRPRVGLVNLEVAPEHRRLGYGRFLVTEIFRRARENMTVAVAVQTSATNVAATALYKSLGFQPVDEAILYRRANLSGEG